MMSLFLLFFHLQTQALLSEKQVIDDVVNQFPTVKIAKANQKQAEARELTARGAFDIILEGDWTDSQGDYDYDFFETRLKKPTSLLGIDIYGAFRESRGKLPIYDGDLETLNQGEWSVGIQMPLLRGLWIDSQRAQLQKTEIEVERQKLELRATELKELEKALHTFWYWKLAFAKWKIQAELFELAKTRDAWLEKRAKSGDIAKFERNDNLRSILQRQSSLLHSEQELQNWEAALLVFVSDESLKKTILTAKSTTWNIEDWTMPADIHSFNQPVQNLLEKALANRPEFSSIHQQLRQLEIDEDLQRNNFFPKLDIKAEHSKDSGTGSASLGSDNTKINLQFEVPLQYRNIRGRVAQIEADQERVKLQRQLLERQWQADLTSLQTQLRVAKERRQLSYEEQKIAQQLAKGELFRYRQGDSNILIVNLREQAAAEAKTRWIENTADVLRNYASITVRLGQVPFSPPR